MWRCMGQLNEGLSWSARTIAHGATRKGYGNVGLFSVTQPAPSICLARPQNKSSSSTFATCPLGRLGLALLGKRAPMTEFRGKIDTCCRAAACCPATVRPTRLSKSILPLSVYLLLLSAPVAWDRDRRNSSRNKPLNPVPPNHLGTTRLSSRTSVCRLRICTGIVRSSLGS